MKKQKPSQKISWQYLFFARRIQTGPRHYAAKLVLIHLGDAANNQGQSWHGYSAIGKLCNNMTASAVRSALLFLRDELGILTWKSGTGGFNKKDTNTYTLNLEAMKAVVAEQGIFDSETGKILYEDPAVDSSQNSGLRAKSTIPRIVSVDSSQASVDSSQTPVDSSGTSSRLLAEECNPNGTPRINPQKQPSPPSPFFAEVCAMSSVPEVTRAKAGQLTPVPSTPTASAPNTQFRYGDELPGLKWSGTRGAYLDTQTGREILPAELDRKITAHKRMMEVN